MDSGVCPALDEARTVGTVVRFWLEKGIQVVPARRGDKFPAIEWRSFIEKERLEYSETIELFASLKGSPIENYEEIENADSGLFNYAVLTGIPSGGLVVLDYDDRDRGVANPVDTLTVETGKGLHYYVRVLSDTRIGNSAYRRAGLDIRGIGGIAIAPPSQHPSGAIYRLVNDKPILEVTEEWYRDYLAKALAGTGEDDSRTGRARPDGWFIETFTETCEQGGRDNTATALTGRLLNGLHSDDVRAIMYVWAEHKCVPPLTRQDIDRIVSSLERKREYEVRTTQQPHSPEERLDVLPPKSSGPEDEQFRGLGDPTRRNRAVGGEC